MPSQNSALVAGANLGDTGPCYCFVAVVLTVMNVTFVTVNIISKMDYYLS